MTKARISVRAMVKTILYNININLDINFQTLNVFVFYLNDLMESFNVAVVPFV